MTTSPVVQRRRRRRLLVAALVVVGVWVVVAAVQLAVGLVDASRGQHDVDAARAQLSAADLVGSLPEASLRAADRSFQSSAGLLHSPLLAPGLIVPVLGRQLESVRDLAAAAAQVSGDGAAAMVSLRSVLDAPHTAGSDRVETLRRLAALADATDRSLGRVGLGPADNLLGPIARRRDQFAAQVADARDRLANASAAAFAAARILQGPDQYLLLMANNAEMRAGSGMFLQAGVLQAAGGHLDLSDVTATASIPLPSGAVPVGGDLEARWGWLKPGVDWRNLGVTPQFDVTAPLAARMWQAATGQHVDGVVAVDVDTLRLLLQVTGPVALPDGDQVDAGTVEQLLLHDQYAGLSDSPAAQLQADRQDMLGQLASVTLDELQSQSLDLRALATAMADATAGRHLMVWSASPSQQAAWTTAGVSGGISADTLLPAVLNRGGNKLDPYLHVEDSLSVARRRGTSRLTLIVTLDNTTPAGQSAYIAGPYPGLGTVYGEYVGLVAVNLPAAASDLTLRGPDGTRPEVKGAEGPTWLMVTPIDLAAGRSARVVVGFDLPGETGSLRVVPSTRLPAAAWSFGSQRFSDSAPHTVSW